MIRADTIDRLLSHKLIAIIRADSSALATEVASALYDGGIRCLEMTLTTPGAIDSIRMLARNWADRMVIGAGTVLWARDASDAIDAGASFIVTPVTRADVVATCATCEIPVACGAFTPTEALTAHELGADFVKIFPAEVGGPAYIKSILAPLPHLRIIPTGGVTIDTCRAFLDSGCVALGVGSSLVSKDLLANQDWPELTRRAAAFVSAVKAAK